MTAVEDSRYPGSLNGGRPGQDRGSQKVYVLRRSTDSSRVEISVNLDSVMSSRAPDMALKPNDVIFVPNNTAKERWHENA